MAQLFPKNTPRVCEAAAPDDSTTRLGLLARLPLAPRSKPRPRHPAWIRSLGAGRAARVSPKLLVCSVLVQRRWSYFVNEENLGRVHRQGIGGSWGEG